MKAIVAHTDLVRSGEWHCSDEVLNRLQENIVRSFLSNYHSYPEDCPHREKMGWTGDAQLVAEMGLYNFDMKSSYLKWLDDFTDAQKDNGQLPGIVPSSGWGFTYGSDPHTRERGYGPQWEGAFIEIPWQLYLFTGDTVILKRYFPFMDRYVKYLAEHSEGDLLWFGIDDHKALSPVTAAPILASGHYYRCVEIMSKVAAILEAREDLIHYRSLQDRIGRAFREVYVNSRDGTVGQGTHTGQALALYFGLVKGETERSVYNRLLQALERTGWHMHSGVLGTRYVINALAQKGDQDLVYRIITDPDYPGYGNWIARGATSMWQTWDGEMSRNHIMFGSLGEWYYKYVAGIRPVMKGAGFRHAVIDPGIPAALDSFNCRIGCPSGEITLLFNRRGQQEELVLTIPEGIEGELRNRRQHREEIRSLDGSMIRTGSPEDPYTTMLGSGTYTILRMQ